MIRRVAVACALILFGGLLAADEPKEPRPGVKPIQPEQPAQPNAGRPNPFTRPVTPALMMTLEENVELLEAQIETKRAYVKAAEDAFHAAKMRDTLLNKAKGGVNELERFNASAEMSSAIALMQIRKCELKELDVRLKYAVKRLHEAKAAPVRPVPEPRPAVDPAQGK
jgi:hypothetical protein